MFKLTLNERKWSLLKESHLRGHYGQMIYSHSSTSTRLSREITFEIASRMDSYH